jgi:magnesium-transporting ATPase (P-type)
MLTQLDRRLKHSRLVLTIVAKQMYRQRALVKSLQIVKTYNSVSVIATDKTGTLTQNKMTVTHVLWDKYGVYKVPMAQPEPAKEETFIQTTHRLSSGVVETVHRLTIDSTIVVRRLSSISMSKPQKIAEFNNGNEKHGTPNEASEIRIQAFRDLLLGATLGNNAELQMVQDAKIGENASSMKS